MVVAGKPRGGAVGLAGYQHSVRQLLETDGAPKGSDRPRRAAVAHDDGQLGPGRQRRHQPDVQFAALAAEVGGALAVHQHFAHSERRGQIERERA
jgi:hypothetical protein